jgi:hypothetical protein
MRMKDSLGRLSANELEPKADEDYTSGGDGCPSSFYAKTV